MNCAVTLKVYDLLGREVASFICRPPNQSLKLTGPAVDDFARVKQTATIGLDLPRAD
jgi:hypothetical protein